GHATNASFWFTVKADYGLMFSTYLGGDSADAGYDIEVDSHGDVYVVGSTAGSGFPADSYDTTHNGGHDVFVTKMDTRTGTLLWSTYIGGSSNDIAYGVAVDPDLNVYVTGVTYSSDFPTVNAYDSTFSGGNDAFVVKLNSQGSALVFSTYFGVDSTKGNSIDVTSAGEAVICGVTQGIPTANAYQSSIGEHSDAFVTKFNSTGTGLVFSTYLGGNGNQYVDGEYRSDEANDVELGPSDTVNVVGTTCSSDFPVANANDTTLGGASDAFVASFISSGAIRFCTYLGGSDKDFGTGVAVNPVGSVVATGTTWSSDFPVQDAYQSSLAGSTNLFVTRFVSTGANMIWSTYFGSSSASGGDAVFNIDDDLFITGSSSASDWPLFNAFDTAVSGLDACVIRFNSTGGLRMSTYLGGAQNEEGRRIAVLDNGTMFVTGETASSDFPLARPIDSTLGGSSDAFVCTIDLDEVSPTIQLVQPLNGTTNRPGTTIDLNITDLGNIVVAANYS
ncbi:MAG: SBBP repeat-containing protein, partial [Candidatus Thorarchaeota archaeon]